MIINICYIFAYIFEQFTSYIYCTNKFIKKAKSHYILFGYIISFIVQYSASFLENPLLNLTIFFLCNFFIVLSFFDSTVLQSLFTAFILSALMLITELLSVYIVDYLLGIDLFLFKSNQSIFFLITCSSKTFYFVISYLLSNISLKEHKVDSEKPYWLVLLPCISIITLYTLAKISSKINVDESLLYLFSIVSILQLISTIIVFLIYNRMIKTIKDNAELKIDNQNTKIKSDYYADIEKQYEKSSIIIHDIKNCLSYIKSLSEKNSNQEIINYINSVYNVYSVDTIKQYSKNKLLNTIISRYATKCFEDSITFSCDVRHIDFSFLDVAELTALFDNLLQNSYEAAIDTDEKFINLIVDIRNENYVMIKLSNSCIKEPRIINNNLITTKANTEIHGIGSKSIRNIVNRHDGSLQYNYDVKKKVFTSTVVLTM